MSANESWERIRNACHSQTTEESHETALDVLQSQVDWLEAFSKTLARSGDVRLEFARSLSSAGGQDRQEKEHILTAVSELWRDLARRYSDQIASEWEEESDGDNDVGVARKDAGPTSRSERFKLETRKATLLARIIRNTVVEDDCAQLVCLCVVPLAISTLWYTTSFTLESLPETQMLMRTIVQMLSNIITENDKAQEKVWCTELRLDGSRNVDATREHRRRPSDLLYRLLKTKDEGTQMAAQVLLVNLTMSSKQRMTDLATNRDGESIQIVEALLFMAESRIEEDEAEEEEEELENRKGDGDSGYGISLQPSPLAAQRRQARFESLGIVYALLTGLFQQGLFDRMFDTLSSGQELEGTQIDASLITSGQVTLLKVLDAYLHDDSPAQSQEHISQVSSDLQSLAIAFERLAQWSASTMTAAMKETSSADAPVDVRLVEVHVGLILILQCLSSLIMSTDRSVSGSAHSSPRQKFGSAESTVTHLRSDGFVVILLDLIKTTSAFSPPISPFKATTTNSAAAPAFASAAPEGHVLSSTGKANLQQNTGTSPAAMAPRPRLDKLKRDLVGLLGMIAYQRTPSDAQDVRRVQDTVRGQGGLLAVLNLTQLDESNPYIRERAIFALRNLLHGNQESQDFIDKLKPINEPAQT